jgi:Zn-dependent protease
MPPRDLFPIPFLIDPRSIALDDLVTFCVSVLIVVLVNSEAQAYVATLLGDARPGAKDRLHFNAFLHLDPLGTLSFLVGGVGWAKRVDVDPTKFEHPTWYLVLTRFAGPFANFLMANVAASIVWLLGALSIDARVFMMVLAVNLTVAIYNVLPLPPLAGGSLVLAVLPEQGGRFGQLYEQVGPYLLLALLLLDRIADGEIITVHLAPHVRHLFALLIQS